MDQITPKALAEWLADESRDKPLLLDVREPHEYRFCRIDGSVSMPMGSVPLKLDELDPARETVVVCHHGGRSAQICMFLAQNGFSRVINLSGGVAQWAAQVDPAMPTY